MQGVRVVIVPHSLPKTKPKACNYGLQFEFASVAPPRKVSLNVTDEAVEPSKPTTPAKPGANEQPKTEGVAKTGSSVPAVAAGTTMIVRKRATR